MKIIKNFIRLLQIILLFLIPLLIIYWIICQVNFDPIRSIQTFLGYILDPVISTVKTAQNFEIDFNGQTADINALVAAGASIFAIITLTFFESFINYLESLIRLASLKNTEAEIKRTNKKLHDSYVKQMLSIDNIYLFLKFKITEEAHSYLISEDDSKETVDKIQKEIIEHSKNFSVKATAASENEKYRHSFIFNDINNALTYALYISDSLKAAKEELAASGSKISFIATMHCENSNKDSGTDYKIAYKLINLAGDNEIISSDLFKNKYYVHNENPAVQFLSRGEYNILDQNIEVFRIAR
jgi:hypothetical protein